MEVVENEHGATRHNTEEDIMRLYSAEGEARGREIAANCNEALRIAVANTMDPVFTDLETEVLWLMSDDTWLEYDTETRECQLDMNHGGKGLLPRSYLVCWRMLGLVRHDPELMITMDDATPEEEATWSARWHNYVLTDAGRSHLETRMKDVAWVRRGDIEQEKFGCAPPC